MRAKGWTYYEHYPHLRHRFYSTGTHRGTYEVRSGMTKWGDGKLVTRFDYGPTTWEREKSRVRAFGLAEILARGSIAHKEKALRGRW